MKSLSILGLAAAFGAASFCQAAGTLSGKATFKGTAPKPEVVKMSSDNKCADQYKDGKKAYKDDTIVNSNGTLANVFVYVKDGVKKEAIPAAPTTPVIFDQKGCLYTPKIVGVRVGQTLEIHNDDDTMHNVHALPKTNTSFNNGMPPKGKPLAKTFSKPEMAVRIKCDVHGWMQAFINVMDHPFFATTDTTGNFTIAGLAPGEYTIEAWHEKLGTKTAKVAVTEGGTANTNFEFSSSATN